MNCDPVLITGAGAVCAAGRTVDSIWESVINGRSAIGPVTDWEASVPPVKVGAVNGVPNTTLVADRKVHKFIDRTDMLGLYAAEQAIQESGVAGLPGNAGRRRHRALQ